MGTKFGKNNAPIGVMPLPRVQRGFDKLNTAYFQYLNILAGSIKCNGEIELSAVMGCWRKMSISPGLG